MAEQRIITKADIIAFWDFSTNVDDEKVNAAILRAQQTDLESLLGAPLYYTFIEDYNGTDFDTAIYKTLYDGGDYTYQGNTVYFRGIKNYLCVSAYIHFVDIARINVVRGGQVYKLTEESEYLEDFQVRTDTRKAKADLVRLERDTLQFIEANTSDYPLFKYREWKERKTAYNFFKIK
jgi:hypothetical protein